MFTHVWLLSGVGAQVGLQIFQARVGLIAAFKLQQVDATFLGQQQS